MSSLGIPNLDKNLESELSHGLDEVEKLLSSHIQGEYPLVVETSRHLVEAGGKRFRPLIALIASHFGNGQSREIIEAAVVCELTHVATLYHDDVMDEAPLRRGVESANNRWGNTVAILTGDYLFSRAFQLMVETGSLQVLDILANASATIAEGEVLQLTAAQDVTTTEDIYLQVVRGKTAALFSAATQVGGVISNASAQQCQALYDYGDALGVAFQIVDDLLDVVGDAKSTGKNVGDDFRERKLTLPLIKAIAAADDHEMVFWKRTIEKGDQVDGDLAHAIDLMHKHGAIEATRADAVAWAQRAQDALTQLPNNEINELLSGLAKYVVERVV